MRSPQPCRLNGRSRRCEPSDTSRRARAGEQPKLHHLPAAGLGSISARQCKADVPDPKVPSAGEDPMPERAFAGSFNEAPPPLANGGCRRTFSSRFENLDQTRLPRAAVAGVSWAACASTASANVSLHEHDHGPLEHPGPPNPWSGRLPVDRKKLSIDGDRRRCAGPGAENYRISAFPVEIARDGDFAPTPIAPGTSCRDRRSSPCPERRGGKSGIANVAPAYTTAATTGSCDARLPRRSPTFTNPRGLPSPGPSNEGR